MPEEESELSKSLSSMEGLSGGHENATQEDLKMDVQNKLQTLSMRLSRMNRTSQPEEEIVETAEKSLRKLLGRKETQKLKDEGTDPKEFMLSYMPESSTLGKYRYILEEEEPKP